MQRDLNTTVTDNSLLIQESVAMKMMMTSLAFVFCLLASVSAWSPYLDDGSSRIVGGGDAKRGAWPWQVLLQKRVRGQWHHICGASIIKDNQVLTAAHCVDGDLPRVLRIVTGEYDRSGSSIRAERNHGISKVFMHAGWDSSGVGYPNDIAVLTLETPIDLSSEYAVVIDLASASSDFVGQKCFLTGWGRTGGSLPTAVVLQEVEMMIISANECASRFSSWPGSVSVKHICAYESGKTACMGDSGGPMSCKGDGGNYVLAGVTSWGSSTCTVTPSVYTKVAEYRQWIVDNAGL